MKTWVCLRDGGCEKSVSSGDDHRYRREKKEKKQTLFLTKRQTPATPPNQASGSRGLAYRIRKDLTRRACHAPPR